MKKLFTLFMLLGLFSATAFGQETPQAGQADTTPTAASFCNDERSAKDVSSGTTVDPESKGAKVEQKDEG